MASKSVSMFHMRVSNSEAHTVSIAHLEGFWQVFGIALVWSQSWAESPYTVRGSALARKWSERDAYLRAEEHSICGD